jgi:xanthine dehydrogenase accessory factor
LEGLASGRSGTTPQRNGRDGRNEGEKLAETENLIALWRRAKSAGEATYLATVVHVQGSSYRKPGAQMLVTAGGERAGAISGGCLDAEVGRRIGWLTRDHSVVETYKSSFEEDLEGGQHGLGCGGQIWVLMEAGPAVDQAMGMLCRALEQREAVVIMHTLAGDRPKTSTYSLREIEANAPDNPLAYENASRAIGERRVIPQFLDGADLPDSVCIPVMPPPRLHVFGAGDDAQPLVRFADELGWHVFVADGRAQLLREDRFPQAKKLLRIYYRKPDELSAGLRVATTGPLVDAGDYAVILTHSYEQDRALLRELLPQRLAYLGILGPLRRTTKIVDEIKDELGLSREECLARLHAPMGLRLGGNNPAVIALSVVAEIQAEMQGPRVGSRSPSRVKAPHAQRSNYMS